MFMALRPIYGKRANGDDYVTWFQLGFVESMEEAKKRFGGSPVLEWVKQ